MDKAVGLMLLTDNAIRLPAGSADRRTPSNAERKPDAEDARLAGILWNFVQARRGTPPSGR
jgi:hypothetical protein